MSLGKNLQFLRKMNNSMTQEALAERTGKGDHSLYSINWVSRSIKVSYPSA